jgi:hypothetical protein
MTDLMDGQSGARKKRETETNYPVGLSETRCLTSPRGGHEINSSRKIGCALGA